jgi:cell division septum initiation protein DivIVA
MSQCTCITDKEITCIVHPTTHSLKERIAELEQQLAELREAVDEVLNASVSSLEYRSNRLQLAVWDLRAVRDKALLQESGDE